MYTYEKSFMESVDGRVLMEGGGIEEERVESAPVGLPFMHNLSVPLGLVLKNLNTGGGHMPLIQSKCNGFMNEADYEKATSGTLMNKKDKEKNKQTRKTRIYMKTTRRKNKR